ncbi:MAG: hypothetical protein V9G42_04695 [Bacteroidia bacterium]
MKLKNLRLIVQFIVLIVLFYNNTFAQCNVGAASSSPSICINTALTPSITHNTTGVTGIGTFTGLPTGITPIFSSNTITISGTPTVSGTFNYSIVLNGTNCTIDSVATGTITVLPNNTVTAGTTTTLCINTSLSPLTHTTTGATGIASPSGLPAGVSASFAGNTITIQGTPTASGTFNYSIPLTGGCGNVIATGTIIVNPNKTVTAGTTTTLCISTSLSPLTHTTTGATGIASPSGLPAGVSASFAGNTITIQGTPTVSGTFNYSIPLTGGCGNVIATGTIIVNINTVTAGTTTTLCINTSLSPLTHTTTGATGIASPSGLPAGVSASFAGNTITIQGTPTVSGTFNYSIPLTGGCGNVNATGTIIVTSINTVTAGTTTTLCINTSLSPLTHTTTGATGIASPSGLPAGVSASFAGNTITIQGTPTASGTFNYSIPLTGGCGNVIATGTIIVNPNNTVTAGTTTTLCINTSLSPLTHTTTGATGIASPSGLPAGVSASFAGNTITIQGTPTASGTFNYSIPLTGGCGNVIATGTIIVNPNNTVTAGTTTTLCINTSLSPLTHTTTGATGIASPSGLPAGVSASFAGNTITIQGTPTASGTFNYSIPLTGGCGNVIATGTIIVNPNNTVTAGTTTTLCINTSLSPLTHTTTGATGIASPSGLPAGVSASFAGNTITIQGTPSASGTFNYSIPLTGGCSNVNATGTIIVNPQPNITSTPNNQTICNNESSIEIDLVSSLSGTTISWTNNNPTINLPSSGSGNIPSFTANNPTNSPVTATIIVHSTAAGCSGTDIIVNITVLPTPLTPVVTNQTNSGGTIQTSVCGGVENLNFNVTNIGGNLITWDVTTSPSVPGLVELKKDSVANTVISMYNGSVNYTATIHAVLTTSLGCTNDTSITIAVAAQIDSIAEAIIVKKQPGNLLVYLDHTADGYQWGFDSIANLQPNNIPGQVYQAFSPNSSFILLDNTLDETNYAYWVRARYGSCFTKVYYNGPFATRIQKNQETEIPDQIITQILPSPNNGNFNITLSGAIYGDIKLKIINTMGQIVYSQNIEKTSPQYIFTFKDLKLNQGLYHAYITATTGERTTTKFLVIYP